MLNWLKNLLARNLKVQTTDSSCGYIAIKTMRLKGTLPKHWDELKQDSPLKQTPSPSSLELSNPLAIFAKPSETTHQSFTDG